MTSCSDLQLSRFTHRSKCTNLLKILVIWLCRSFAGISPGKPERVAVLQGMFIGSRLHRLQDTTPFY